MGCVSSKILAKSGSFQEKVSSLSLGHSFHFQRSSGAIEDMILSTSNSVSKSNGDHHQFLALLRTSSTSSSSARKANKEPEVGEPAAKIETIDVSGLLAGLEEEGCCCTCTAERGRELGDEGEAPWSASAGRARSFRTVEEFDAMLLLSQTQSESGSSSEGPVAVATEHGEELAAEVTAAATTAGAEHVSGTEAAAGAKRRARARQLGELNLPTVAAAAGFDFSKSGSLRDWLRQGGQIFSPGSYVTPRFGTAPASPPDEQGEADGGGEQQQAMLFDPELVAQFERAMEQLSEDEGRVLDEILEALELEAAEKDAAASVVGGVGGHEQPAGVAVDAALVQQV